MKVVPYLHIHHGSWGYACLNLKKWNGHSVWKTEHQNNSMWSCFTEMFVSVDVLTILFYDSCFTVIFVGRYSYCIALISLWKPWIHVNENCFIHPPYTCWGWVLSIKKWNGYSVWKNNRQKSHHVNMFHLDVC